MNEEQNNNKYIDLISLPKKSFWRLCIPISIFLLFETFYSIADMFWVSQLSMFDALAVGVTFAFFEVNLLLSISIIGIITFVLSFLGVIIGNKFGDKFQNRAELAGGIVLIIIGLKILLEHLGILAL